MDGENADILDDHNCCSSIIQEEDIPMMDNIFRTDVDANPAVDPNTTASKDVTTEYQPQDVEHKFPWDINVFLQESFDIASPHTERQIAIAETLGNIKESEGFRHLLDRL